MSAGVRANRVQWIAQPRVGECWAACAHMLMQASGATTPSLESIVSLGRSIASDDDATLHDHELTALLAALGLRTAFVERALRAPELDAVLDDGRAVIAVHAQPASADGEGGHAVVIGGRSADARYHVLDPILGERHVPFDALVAPDAKQRWCMTWSLLAPLAARTP